MFLQLSWKVRKSLKGSTCDLRGTQAAHSKKRDGGKNVKVGRSLCRDFDNQKFKLVCYVFLLAAARVDPGRNALQSAEQRCQWRYSRIHRVGCTSITLAKTCKKPDLTNNNHAHLKSKVQKRIRAKVQKRALVKSHGKHLRRSKKVIDVAEMMALVKPRGKHLRQSQRARPRKMGGYSS